MTDQHLQRFLAACMGLTIGLAADQGWWSLVLLAAVLLGWIVWDDHAIFDVFEGADESDAESRNA